MSQLSRFRERNLDLWIVRHQELLVGINAVLMTLALVADWYIVEVLGENSISWRTWTAESLHPTIDGFIILFGVTTCWLVRLEWIVVMWNAAVIIGHLGLHF
jgi:hypothetical protein